MNILLCVLLFGAAADKDVDAIEGVTLEELLGSETTVSSSTMTRLRDAPGIVTVLTRDDILRLGARDLGELLPLVPGFDVHVDVYGVVGNLFRGLYASDGRALILVDGIELNENAYGSIQTFARYPIDDVERIEILRGPGSALFGGYASLCVIEITTRGAARRSDLGFAGVYGQAAFDAPFKDQALTAMGGTTVDVLGGLDLSLSAHAGTRNQSLRDITDAYGVTASMRDSSQARALFVNASARLPWVQARLIIDGYEQQNITGYEAIQQKAGWSGFPAAYFDIQAPLTIAPGWIVTPSLFVTRQLPWRPHNAEEFPDLGDYRVVNDRLRVGVRTQWDALPRLTLSGGGEATIDNAVEPTGERDADYFVVDFGEDVDRYLNGALYGEAVIDTDLFLLTAGIRGEQHSVYGGSVVPRVALTRAVDGAHAKLLVAGSFRAPAIENIRYAVTAVTPERTRVIELEGGMALSSSVYLTANAFDITIIDPLVYSVVDTVTDGYQNFPQTGTRGFELTLLGAAPFGRLEVNYGFATAGGKNQVPIYAVPGDDARLLGASTHKGVVVASLFLSPGVTTTMTAIVRSERAAQVGYDEVGGPVYGELPASAMLGGALHLADVVGKGVELTLGVRNALGEDFHVVQPFASGHVPLPLDDREVYLRLAGRWP